MLSLRVASTIDRHRAPLHAALNESGRAYLYLRILGCQLSVTVIPLAITRVRLFSDVIEASVYSLLPPKWRRRQDEEGKIANKGREREREKGRQCEPKISHQLPSQQKRAETNAFFSTPAGRHCILDASGGGRGRGRALRRKFYLRIAIGEALFFPRPTD